MRLFLFAFFLVTMPVIGNTTAPVPANPAETSVYPLTFSDKKPGVKHGFLKRIVEKMLIKRLKKAFGRSGDSDGKWLAISGLTLGLLGALSFVFISYTGFYLPLALGLAGLALSIFGLIKARQWQDTGLIRVLAIVGIVLGALVVAPALGLIGR